MAKPESNTLGDLLTATTLEVCERLAIPHKSGNVNIVQLDSDIRNLYPALAKVMWDYFYSYHRFSSYSTAIDQGKPWTSLSELADREKDLAQKKNIFYEQLEVFATIAVNKESKKW